MDIEAIVYQILPPQKGTSARGEWSSQDVVFEVPAEFNNKICVTFRNDKIAEITAINVGDKVKVSFNIASREWNSKWYTSLNAWRLVKEAPQTGAAAPAPSFAAQPPMEAYAETVDESSDLPF